jgi:RNA polymerase sigma factor (sigma-70 family)
MAVGQKVLPPTASAVDELYKGYAAWLVRAVRRRGGGEASEDIVQEAFLRASSYSADELARHPKALLLKIARSVMLNAARDACRQKRDPSGYEAVDWQGADQEHNLLLGEIIAAIPEVYRDAFVLHRFGGMTYVEIARAHGVTVKVVEWRVSRALAICSERLRG